MPRNGAGIYTLPPGSVIANGDVSDASDINTPLSDIVADLNAARPIVSGGTGATSAAAALAALGGPTLTSIAALGTAADRMLYSTALNAWAETPITAAGRALLDDADAAAQRATLGLGAVTAPGEVVADLNAITVSGWARFAIGAANAPIADNSGYVLTITSGSVGVQMAWGHLGSTDDTFSWMRWRGSSGWRSWVKLRWSGSEIKTGVLNASGDAPTYACRAWVNFNGTGTVAIRAAGNVSSITDNGVGDYTINFTTAMPDANYVVCGSAREDAAANAANFSTGSSGGTAQTASAARVLLTNNVISGNADSSQVHVAIFR